jgi:hypothetical protein
MLKLSKYSFAGVAGLHLSKNSQLLTTSHYYSQTSHRFLTDEKLSTAINRLKLA